MGFLRTSSQIQIQLGMTDLDVVQRFHRAVRVGKVYGPYQKYREDGMPYKPMWRWHTGEFQMVQYVIAMFWPWLGERRKSKATEILSTIEVVPYGFTGRKHSAETKAKTPGRPRKGLLK